VKVRGLTFESFVIALAAGFADPTAGPYLIEQNVFKNSFEGVELALRSPHPSQVRSNEFIDVARPFFMFGGTAHFRHNVTTNPRPEDIPLTGQPIQTGVIVTSPGEPCENNLVAGNRVDGASDGFFLVADGLDAECRNTVIRDNVFTNQTIYTPGDTGTLAVLVATGGGTVSGTLLQDNSLEGTNGIGTFAEGVTHSKFVGNTIANVRKRADLEPPLAPGGIGILLVGGSFGNEVRANDFPHVESCAVVLREDTHDNQVVEPEDRVLDQGTDNQVVGKPCHEDPVASVAGAAADLRSNPKFSQLLDLARRRAGR
jgi:hypothetical protein